MTKRHYPAVLERADGGALALWFPDFPDCVAAATTQDEAIAKAERALEAAVTGLSEREMPLPFPSAVDSIVLPQECRFLAFVMIGVTPPDPSERVNIYLPRSLLEKADARASELGMSRSSFFGLAVSIMLGARIASASALSGKPR